MKRLLLWPVDHPGFASGLMAILTVAFALQIPRLESDVSTESLMLERDPARQYYEEVKRKFGSDVLTIVLVKADDVFTVPVLETVQRLSEALERLEGVRRVESLTTVNNLKGQEDFLNTEPLVGAEIPTDDADLQRIRADTLGNRIFVGNLVSQDAKATAILVYTEADAADKQFDDHFVDRVEALIAQESAPGLSIYQMGSPFSQVTLRKFLEQDQHTLVPIGVALLLLILLLAFRTFQGVVIPLVTAGLSIFWTLGMMALFGLPMTPTTAIIPSLLIAIGFTEDVHILSEYHHLLEQGMDKLAAIRRTMDQTLLPILVTTGTTVVGFLGLITTDITALVQFGYASSLGLTANFVVTVVVVPILVRIWPVPRHFRTVAFADESLHGLIPRLMEWLGGMILRYRIAIVAVTGLLMVVSLVGLSRLRVDNDPLGNLPERSVVRERFNDLHVALAGSGIFYVVVETGVEGGVKQPDLLRKIVGLQDFLTNTGQIDTSVSVADYMRKMHREMNGGDPAFEIIPETPEQVAQYLLLIDGKEVTKLIDFNAATANIVVRHNLTSSWQLSALLKRLNTYIAQTFPVHLRVRYTGEAILINNAADYMAINEITGFFSILLIIGLIHALLFMSLRAGFLSLIPNVIPLLLNYGLMGLLGVPLNPGTAMIATIAIGIAVDDTVHHMVTYSRQLNQHHEQRIAMFNTMKAQGRPIIYVSLALAAGFIVLVFSNFVYSIYFGVFAALAMLIAMICELVLTPILMYSTRLVTLWDMVLLKMDPDIVRTAPLFRDLSRWEARKVVLMGKLQSFQPGELVLQKGEAGTEMYMVVSGRMRVFDLAPGGGEQTLARLEPGAIFGEMGLVGGGARSANVVAESAGEVLKIDFPALERLRKRFPFTGAKFYRNLARVLSERLRDTTEMFMQQVAPAAPPYGGGASPRESA